MKKTRLLLFTATCLLLASCSSDDEIRQRKFDFTDFTYIEGFTDFDIVVQKGDAFSIIATGDPDNISGLYINKVDERLVLRYINGVVKRHPRTQINITMPTLEKLTASHSSTAQIVGFEPGDIKNLELRSRDQSSITIDAAVDTLKAVVLTAGHIEIKGAGKKLTAYVRDGSRLDAAAFHVPDATITAMNLSRATLHASDNLQATITESSTVQYNGEPEITAEVDATSELNQNP